jgi:hypothetical protein
MTSRSTDAADFRFLTASGASLDVELNHGGKQPVLLIRGNRAALLSLANILLWLVGNSWCREFLALAELPFLRLTPTLSVTIRLTLGKATGREGMLVFLDRNEQLEWAIGEVDLQRVALILHGLVSAPYREYYTPVLAEGSEAGVEFRMTDAVEWD